MTKLKNSKATIKPKRPLFILSPLIIWDAILFAIFIWANWVNFTDRSGWSGLLTIPILLLVFVMLFMTAIGLVVLALKAPKKSHERAYLFLGSALSLLPITCTLMYAVLSNSLAQAYKQRSETPITQQEARQLIETCQVETISRHNGGKLQLNDKVPVMPGETTNQEYRTFDVKYYDELLTLTRQKEVQDRCGFVPSYDIERPRQPVANSWITKDEALAIIQKCAEPTRLNYDARYYPELELPKAESTGILLSLRLNVWNDEKDSSIYIMGADSETLAILQAEERKCYTKY